MTQKINVLGILSLLLSLPLQLKAETLVLTDSNFLSTVNKSEVPVLVDFWAPWCGPCLKLAPTIDELAKNSQGKAIVSKVNIDEHPEIASQYNVKAIPTIIIFKGGEVVNQIQGVQTYEVLASELSKSSDSVPEDTKFPSMMERLTAIEAQKSK